MNTTKLSDTELNRLAHKYNLFFAHVNLWDYDSTPELKDRIRNMIRLEHEHQTALLQRKKAKEEYKAMSRMRRLLERAVGLR